MSRSVRVSTGANRRALPAIILAILAQLPLSTPSRGDTLNISDTAFSPEDWSATLVVRVNGGSHSAWQELSGGNGGAFRKMVHSMPMAGAKTRVLHLYVAQEYDPAASGAIVSIDYSEDRIEYSPPWPDASIGARFALRQGASIYLAKTAINFTNLTWSTETLLGLQADDFEEFFPEGNDPESHPDFSASGAPILFGYYRYNSTTVGAGTTYHGIDNWSVSVEHASPEPVFGSVSGVVTADCPSPETGLWGVTVDAFEIGSGDLAAADTTDADGRYVISNLAAGEYLLSVNTPIGYANLSGEVSFAAAGEPLELVLQDQTFLPQEWTEIVVFSENGATGSTSQISTGGHPGAYRRMTHVLPGPARICVLHLNSAQVYDPGSSGAITRVDYSEDRIEIGQPFPGALIGAYFALRQDERNYIATPELWYTDLAWSPTRLVGLAAEDFQELTGEANPLTDPESHPDFSAAGAPITFGYGRRNTTTVGAATFVHGIDNWAVTLRRSVPPPLVDFALACPEMDRQTRAAGFWKHQIGVATGGNGRAQMGAEELCALLDLVIEHFTENPAYPVAIYDPPGGANCSTRLEAAKSILNLRGSAAMVDRAGQHLMALLLNVGAGYISQTEIVSEDGATVSQAILYCYELMSDPSGQHEVAKAIAEEINDGGTVAGGVIPLDTPNLAYRMAPDPVGHVESFFVGANPAAGARRIRFGLEEAGRVNLSVYDLMGRRLATILDRDMTSGTQSLIWDGRSDRGRPLPPGVYLGVLRTPAHRRTAKLVIAGPRNVMSPR